MERNIHKEQTLMQWQCRDRILMLSDKPLIMGILNVTPDSFSDGGQYFTKEDAVSRVSEMIREGADIIDIGGESSRPGALLVPEEEEAKRVLPVIEEISKKLPDVIISVDTRKSNIAYKALEAGAHIINDISALRFDEKMLEVVKKYSAGVILMHMKGEPATMQNNPVYNDVLAEIKQFFDERISFCTKGGIQRGNIAIDPGIGFGKTTLHNLKLIANLNTFTDFKLPIVMGLSRKRFIGELTERTIPAERLYGTIAGNLFAYLKGANIIRVHDVKAVCEAVKVFYAIMKEEIS